MKPWKKLSTKQLLDHPRLSVYEDDVQLPSGHKTKYIRYGNTAGPACVIAVNKDGKILVQKEYSYPPNAWIFQLPGGALEKGETPIEGAAREFAEEAGMQGTLTELGWFYVYNRRTADKFHVFVATDLSPKEATKDLEEEFESFWFTVKEIDAMIAKNDIPNHSFLAAWSLYKAKMS